MTRGLVDTRAQGRGSKTMPASAHTAQSRAHERVVPRLALSPDEAADALGCSRDFLDAHVALELRWVRRGRRKFVAVAELERWLQATSERTL